MDCADSLRKICADSRITESVANGLIRQAEFLKRWKEEIRPATPTETARVRSLQKISELADKLKNAIDGLEFEDRLALDSEFFSYDDMLDTGTPARELDLGGYVVPRITIAASRAIERIPSSGKAGAAKLIHRQADFIRCIASEVMPAGIVPTHTGVFRKICEAVFKAAGVPYSDKAHRYFMEHVRPSFRDAGYSL
ncbi:MAG: hypothetical protein PHX60_12720 [Giesbergeria sp.]|uniref:hypothetical protein n=1 Tax=Giesbergeria sp. TaxID=2818473 RepID=UPI002624AF81|nr:hypothetical protein [Giesbergeria sp.]MDD2610525.1 hypothetical protein [Giesbergeria sp.]